MNEAHLATETIYLWLDGRLPQAAGRQVQSHLAGCLVCQRRVARAATLKTALHQRRGAETAPVSLRATVQARLRAADSLNHNRRPRLWLGLAVAAAVLLALGGVSAWWAVSTVGWPSTAYLVEAHSQAEQQNRLRMGDENGVSGGDLSRQLGWPAPIPTGEGMSLLSGRVDQMDGQPIAHLLYRLNDGAVMSLFMWQGPLPSGAKLAARPYEGKTIYVGQLGDEAIVLWPQGGRVYACISSTDLERLLEVAGDVWDVVSSTFDGPRS